MSKHEVGDPEKFVSYSNNCNFEELFSFSKLIERFPELTFRSYQAQRHKKESFPRMFVSSSKYFLSRPEMESQTFSFMVMWTFCPNNFFGLEEAGDTILWFS